MSPLTIRFPAGELEGCDNQSDLAKRGDKTAAWVVGAIEAMRNKIQ